MMRVQFESALDLEHEDEPDCIAGSSLVPGSNALLPKPFNLLEWIAPVVLWEEVQPVAHRRLPR